MKLPPEKLLSALERSLVSVVNDVGVDINKAVTESYYRHLLPFVAGLGPRKAQAMLKKIGQLVCTSPHISRKLVSQLSYFAS